MSTRRRPRGLAATDGPTGLTGRHGGGNGGDPDDAMYVVVVVDQRLGSVETYGPLVAPRAVQVLDDLRALLDGDGLTDVTVTACRLHLPGRRTHPDDP